MELLKIHFSKPDNSKIVVKYYMYVLKQIVYNHARVSRDVNVACVQTPLSSVKIGERASVIHHCLSCMEATLFVHVDHYSM